MLVKAIITKPPIVVTEDLSAIDRLEPITVCNRVLSAVKREMISPVRKRAKNTGLCSSNL